MTKLYNAMALRLALVLTGVEVPSPRREEGQTLAEYALILALIAVVVVGVLLTLGGKISSIFSSISSSLGQ
jgi:pilus assembly protein Flp/PilA